MEPEHMNVTDYSAYYRGVKISKIMTRNSQNVSINADSSSNLVMMLIGYCVAITALTIGAYFIDDTGIFVGTNSAINQVPGDQDLMIYTPHLWIEEGFIQQLLLRIRLNRKVTISYSDAQMIELIMDSITIWSDNEKMVINITVNNMQVTVHIYEYDNFDGIDNTCCNRNESKVKINTRCLTKNCKFKTGELIKNKTPFYYFLCEVSCIQNEYLYEYIMILIDKCRVEMNDIIRLYNAIYIKC